MCVHVRTCAHAMCVYVCVFVLVCVCACSYVCTCYVCVCVCLFVLVCVCVCYNVRGFLPTSSHVCKVSIFQLRHSPFFTWFVLRFTSFS